MKPLLIASITISITLTALAGLFPEDWPAYNPNPRLEIEWKVRTNAVPQQMWVYKVVPQGFSPGVMSNAMAIGLFGPRDILNPREKTYIQIQDVRPYPTRFLKVAPAAGWMKYYDRNAKTVSGRPVTGVPDRDEAERLARDYLFRLGIDRSQVGNKAATGYEIKKAALAGDGTEKNVQIIGREVSLARCLDGIAFFGKGSLGGFSIEFGNSAKVASFELLWRNLMPERLGTTGSADDIIAAIKAGKSVQSTPSDVSRVNRLSLTSVTPFYLGSYWDTQQDFCYPIVVLEGEGDSEDGKQAVGLLCPILLDMLQPKGPMNK